MSERWKLQAEIRSGVLLVDENHTINLLDEFDTDTEISFDFPQKAEAGIWPKWDNEMPTHIWDYKITYKFKAVNEKEAQYKAWTKLENIVAILSFLSSSPVIIKSHGSITNAPDNPIEGNQYTTISLSFDQGWVSEKQPLLELSDMEFLSKIIVPDKLIRIGQERVIRSIRWLQNSHLSISPVEEFMSLILAFESISHLIKPAETHYWHCSKCDEDIKVCPNCAESTEWVGSGKTGMEHFVIEYLSWKKSDWNTIWKLRNKLFHGTQDIVSEQQQMIVVHLPKLEEAVVSALRYLLRIPKNAPPRRLRQRGFFYGSKLYVQWTKN